MKNIFNKFSEVVKRFNIYKKESVSNRAKAETLNNELQNFLAQFKDISEKIDENNAELMKIVEDEERKQLAEIERLERIRAAVEKNIKESKEFQGKIRSDIKNNDRIKSRIDEFII